MLRARTREAHARLDALVPLTGGRITAGGYGATLAAMLRVVAPVEGALACWGASLTSHGFPSAGTIRSERLAADLDVVAWGASCNGSEAPAFEIRSLDHAVGVLYVLEGAALGGQLIAREAARTLGLTAQRGACYFAGYGEPAGPRWRAFCAALESFGAARPDGWPQVVDGAAHTFAAFTRALADPPAARRCDAVRPAAA